MSAGLRVSPLGFLHDKAGASAVEFSIIALPFIFVLLLILQMAIYYMTQSALDAGVIQEADTLVNTFYSGTTPSVPTIVQLRTAIATKAGGLINNDATLTVELRQFTLLAAAPLPITNTVDASVPNNILALRAQASVATFMPGFGLAVVRSSAIVRRQAK